MEIFNLLFVVCLVFDRSFVRVFCCCWPKASVLYCSFYFYLFCFIVAPVFRCTGLWRVPRSTRGRLRYRLRSRPPGSPCHPWNRSGPWPLRPERRWLSWRGLSLLLSLLLLVVMFTWGYKSLVECNDVHDDVHDAVPPEKGRQTRQTTRELISVPKHEIGRQRRIVCIIGCTAFPFLELLRFIVFHWFIHPSIRW